MMVASFTKSPRPTLIRTDFCAVQIHMPHIDHWSCSVFNLWATDLAAAVLEHIAIQQPSGLRCAGKNTTDIVAVCQELWEALQLPVGGHIMRGCPSSSLVHSRPVVVDVRALLLSLGWCAGEPPHCHSKGLAGCSHCSTTSTIITQS